MSFIPENKKKKKNEEKPNENYYCNCWMDQKTVTYSMYNRTDEVDVIRKQIV